MELAVVLCLVLTLLTVLGRCVVETLLQVTQSSRLGALRCLHAEQVRVELLSPLIDLLLLSL